MSRGLKLLQLARKSGGECESKENVTEEKMYEFHNKEDEEDPWRSFRKWKENYKNIVNSPKSNIFSHSTNSWKPIDEEESSDSYISDNGKNISESKTHSTVSCVADTSTESAVVDLFEPFKLNQKIESEYYTIQFGEPTAVNGFKSEESTSAGKQIDRINILSNILIKPPVETSRRKGRVWDRKDRCPYCNLDITNFSRHLIRKHSKEDSVIKILECPKGSIERKKFIDLLRKEANLSVYRENIIRPVQRPSSNSNNNSTLSHEYLPCKHCKGLYKKKSLGRHGKKCFFNRDKLTKTRYASEGQTMLAFTESRKSFLDRLRLKTEVFDKMHADRISLCGKSDPIVCQYAEDYLRKHKRPHIKNLVSNKIRELGRLLIPLKDIYNIDSMLETLKPEHFDKVVSAVRIMTGYDNDTKSFQTPSLALHFRTILLAICSAAKTLLLKKDPVLPVSNYDESLSNLKKFRELVASNWKFEMGSLALKDLNEKHSNKPQKLPLSQDIILFKNHCHSVADKAIKNLRENVANADSYKKLSEATLSLTILLNRKRVGDVQYLKLETYAQSPTNTNEEECINILTEAEKQLSKHFKRVLSVGKGSKAVPILFPQKIQEYIQIMLDVRNNTELVPKENPFLFALVNSSSKWIDGSAVLRKFAISCGAHNPQTLTSSRLRKQIATVLQILNLSEIEMEQVATFMGHTKKTHEEFYRLPQEVYQTSKIAKLLLMVEKGITKEHEGNTLDQIDIELETWQNDKPSTSETIVETEEDQIIPSNLENEENGRIENSSPLMPTEEIVNDRDSSSPPLPIEKKVKETRSRGSWNVRQKNIMLSFFKKHIKNKISPKKNECLELQQINKELFKDKSWVQIKVFVYNTYKNK